MKVGDRLWSWNQKRNSMANWRLQFKRIHASQQGKILSNWIISYFPVKHVWDPPRHNRIRATSHISTCLFIPWLPRESARGDLISSRPWGKFPNNKCFPIFIALLSLIVYVVSNYTRIGWKRNIVKYLYYSFGKISETECK